ncbi:YraN family protein [Vibrio gelatinilyticus]|jgi:putative endonuclease|uniref:YraN family protein n=1 Tax=Vibrio gelatinilyticus TaxID=2893468 RepID=UPI002445687A|nr:YraN family protein [Vibrio gelatinilyticus]
MNLLKNQVQSLSKRLIGQNYEALAQKYLIRHGLTPVAMNFSAKCGEIDLIMKDSHCIVFIEVKYRKNDQFGSAAEMVTPSKAKKLIKTAQFWLSKHGLSFYDTEFRFDVLAIEDNGSNINWIKNAITQG